MTTTWKMKARETGGEEGAKPVWLEELAGSCTSGEKESRMKKICQCPVRHLAQKGTVITKN